MAQPFDVNAAARQPAAEMTAVTAPAEASTAAEPAVAARRPFLYSLDALRVVAALLVFFVHTEFFLPQSWSADMDHLGVVMTFFFMLSGFALAYSSPPSMPAAGFMRRRLARLMPVYLATWLIGVVLALVRNAPHGPITLVMTLFLMQAWVWPHQFFYRINIPAWYLSVLMVFYVAYLGVRHRWTGLGRRGNLAIVGACGVMTVVVIPAVAMGIHNPQTRLWFLGFSPVTRVFDFLAGVFLARFAVQGGRIRLPAWAGIALLVGSLALTYAVPVELRTDACGFVPMALLMMALVNLDLDGRKTFLHHPVFAGAAARTYAFYLVHVLVIQAILLALPAGHRSPGETGLLIAGAFVAGIACAAVLFRYVEVPLSRRLGGGSSRPAVAAVARPGLHTRTAAAAVSMAARR